MAVIAVALVKLAFGVGVTDARAEPGAIACEAFYADQVSNMKRERSLEAGRAYATEVSAWLATHPGEPVFRTTLVNSLGGNAAPLGYIDIVCVR
jgi:hypothetical protein